MAAHDMRNPLSTISGLSEILMTMDPGDLDAEEQQTYLQTINRVSNQMLRLINDLLDVSVIESGKCIYEMHPGHLEALAGERIKLLQLAARKKGITLHAELGETPPTPFDEDRFSQVMDNLIGNALKFSPPDSQITIRTGVEGERVFFQVADQGPGIPEAEKSNLFGAFQMLSTQPTGNEKGSGLGLSIVKKIIDAHHGEITVDSPVGQGAVFTVWLAKT